MRFQATAWIRDPQGGREDSPDGRFILCAGRRCRYLLIDNRTGRMVEVRTLAEVRATVRLILDTVSLPLEPEVEADVVDFLRRFDPRTI